MVLMSRQGKIRLSEFFSSFSESDKRRILRDIAADVLPRPPKMCNIIEKGTYKFVYRRYASLYFVAGVPLEMNELLVLEQIHLFVEALDGYFNSGEYKKQVNTKIHRREIWKIDVLIPDQNSSVRTRFGVFVAQISSYFVRNVHRWNGM